MNFIETYFVVFILENKIIVDIATQLRLIPGPGRPGRCDLIVIMFVL